MQVAGQIRDVYIRSTGHKTLVQGFQFNGQTIPDGIEMVENAIAFPGDYLLRDPKGCWHVVPQHLFDALMRLEGRT